LRAGSFDRNQTGDQYNRAERNGVFHGRDYIA
jgi:hypothetical protein